VEKTAFVRHAARRFVTGARITVPFFAIILRKGYGLGAQATAGGSFSNAGDRHAALLPSPSHATIELGGEDRIINRREREFHEKKRASLLTLSTVLIGTWSGNVRA